MMKKLIFLILIVVNFNSLFSQEIKIMGDREIGIQFPQLKAETLSGIEIKYPDDVKGKVTLILIAFRRETQRKLDSWLEPFSKLFEADSSVQFYEIPMLSAGWKLMSPIIDGGMRSGIPKQKHGNVTTYYGNVDKYCEQLGMKDKSDAYIFLLDSKGTIQWRSNGFATQEKLKELFERIETLKNSF